MWDVVDLGTKQGYAIDEFRRKRETFFDAEFSITPEKCLAIDHKTEYWEDLTRSGYKPQELDLANDEAIANLPEANYYLAWHFLEHVPTKEWSNKLVKAALSKSRYGCWFRLPSFEPDEVSGEGALRAIGLRWTWSHWVGHPTHYLIEDCKNAVNEWFSEHGEKLERGVQVRVTPAGRTWNTHDEHVVFIDAPIDTTEYSPEMGKKPSRNFTPPLITEWNVVVRF